MELTMLIALWALMHITKKQSKDKNGVRQSVQEKRQKKIIIIITQSERAAAAEENNSLKN